MNLYVVAIKVEWYFKFSGELYMIFLLSWNYVYVRRFVHIWLWVLLCYIYEDIFKFFKAMYYPYMSLHISHMSHAGVTYMVLEWHLSHIHHSSGSHGKIFFNKKCSKCYETWTHGAWVYCINMYVTNLTTRVNARVSPPINSTMLLTMWPGKTEKLRMANVFSDEND